MHARITRLAGRVSAVSLKAVRPSSSPALFTAAHAPVASTSQLSFRSLSSTRFLSEEPKSTLDTLSTSHPTDSEAAVKADTHPIEAPVEVESPLASSEPSAEAVAAAQAADEQARTVFVGGISWNVDGEWLKDELLKALEVEQGVESVRIARDPMGKSKGFAFVILDSPALAKSASELTLDVDGRTSEIRLAGEGKRERTPRPSRESDSLLTSPRNSASNTIFLGNVPWGVTPELLEDLMSPFGVIKRVSLPTDSETGRSRGIAYIEFDGPGAKDVVKEAFEGQGFEVDGRALKVDYAEEKSNGDRPRGGGRGGFGGRGGGRGGFGGRGGGRGGGGGFGGGRGGSREGGRGGFSGRREGGEGGQRERRGPPRERWD